MTTPAEYHNPIARDGDFADPFVLRHDGRYYLYATNPDVRCWSSDDLVHWQPEGPTIAPDTFPGLVPFAPEVVYADGAFFMYTSPSGHGHIVLRADAPTGPFSPVTGNVGHAIDGNVFVDDDGQRYFYWAGDEGIWGCAMPSPTEFGEPVFTGIHMNGWTEGPFVSKRDGIYQMTLTGNHYLSSGYRIDAAASDHPLTGYRPAALNPILVGADGPATGLGHSSTVIGPDLVSTWIVYHNLNPDASRDLNIDRQIGTGLDLMVLGPTTSAPAPRLPDFAWSGHEPGPAIPDGPFTAELNLTATRGSRRHGISLGDTLIIELAGPQAVVDARTPDGRLIASAPIPSGFDEAALHCWTLESDGQRLQVRLDGRRQFDVSFTPGPASPLRPFADDGRLKVGNCALTLSTPALADQSAVVAVPGRFWASSDAASEHIVAGAVIEHDLHVQRGGAARVYLTGAFGAADELVIAIDDDERTIRVDAPSRLAKVGLELPEEARRLSIRGVAGAPLVRLVTVGPMPAGGAEFAEESLTGWGKRLLAKGPWDDVIVHARLAADYDGPDAHADVLVRASQLAEGGEGADTRLGIDFLLGYSVQLWPGRIVLARHNYDTTMLAEASAPVGVGPLDLTVRISGSAIAVDLDGRELLRADDDLPYPAGGIGLRTANARLHAVALRIVPDGHP
jgi:hypothetical protein